MWSRFSSTHLVTSAAPETTVLPSGARASALVALLFSCRRTVYGPFPVVRVTSTTVGSLAEPPLHGSDSFAKRGPAPLEPKKAHRIVSKSVDLPAPLRSEERRVGKERR